MKNLSAPRSCIADCLLDGSRSDNEPAAPEPSLPPQSAQLFRRLAAGLACGALGLAAPVWAAHYEQTNLVSDVPGVAPVTDAGLVNAWGLARSATSPWWVADNGSSLSTLYNGAGTKLSLVVSIPSGAPTGIVFNGTTDFQIATGQPARFLFVTEEGGLAGWNPAVNLGATVLMVNNAGRANYKGLALAQSNGANYLYAANFSAGTIDVFDKVFAPAALPPMAFRDRHVPRGFAPFNVQAIGDKVYVAYARQDAQKEDEVEGRGLGFVSVFAPDGKWLMRLRRGPWMNAPWGIALAPANFGRFSGKLLVGQFGSGRIAAFDPHTGNFLGLVRGAHGKPIEIDGLWGLAFGNDGSAGPSTTLYFAAGPDDETHGLFGTLTPAPHDEEDDEPAEDVSDGG